MTALLELEDVHAWYARTKILHSLGLVVQEGRITTLLGANGAGKTTTLRTICKILVRSEGKIVFDGRDLSRASTHGIARMGIAHVPDGRGTFTHLTVEENLQLGGYTLARGSAVRDGIARVFHLFPRLEERRRQQAGTLSGGEQQMLAIGRALMPRPKLLLLDEPSFGLAPLIVRDIFQTLRSIAKEEGVSMLLVEQNANQALRLADRAYLMDTGRMVHSDTAEAMRQNETVQRVYLGQAVESAA